MFYIYCIRNSTNGKMYIGKTFDYSKRISKHKNIAKGHHPKEFKTIHAAIAKYGWDGFEHFILKI